MALFDSQSFRTNFDAGRTSKLLRGLSLIVVVAVGMTWVTTASASCGHYLYRNGKPVGENAANPQSVDLNTETQESAQDVPFELPIRRCSGPNCSEDPLPLVPVSAAPVNLVPGFDQFAVLASMIGFVLTRDPLDIPESERGAHFEPSDIFRPPAA